MSVDRFSRGRPLTPDGASRYRQLRSQIEAERPSIRERRDAQEQAEQEPGFSGDLRRAITAACRPSHELAAAAGVDVQQFEEFRAGRATLPSDVIDRLVDVLELRLTAAAGI